MDPTELGLTAAGLVAKKALESGGSATGAAAWEALGRVTDRLRSWFQSRGATDGETALELVETIPDSHQAMEQLAGQIGAVAEVDPEGAGELETAVIEAEQVADHQVATFINQVRDQAQVGRIVQQGPGSTYHEGG